jgi:hypothetical protein
MLHVIQDFYSHSSYIEIMVARGAAFEAIDQIPFWTAAGSARLEGLKASGLASRRVLLSSPKQCKGNAPDLDKDDADGGHGAERTPWDGRSYHDVARKLATDATYAFFRYAFDRWSALRAPCENAVGFMTLTDGSKSR